MSNVSGFLHLANNEIDKTETLTNGNNGHEIKKCLSSAYHE